MQSVVQILGWTPFIVDEFDAHSVLASGQLRFGYYCLGARAGIGEFSYRGAALAGVISLRRVYKQRQLYITGDKQRLVVIVTFNLLR